MEPIPEENSDSRDEDPCDSDGSRNFPQTPDSEEKAKKPKRELTKDEQFLKDFLARSFGLRPPPKQVLSTVDIQGIANLISEGKVRKVITMAGAGISTSAGIPDFRSMNTGLYFQLDQFNLPRPEALFSIDYFKENPIPYYTVRKRMLLENYKPTPCHYFIRMLAEKGILLRHFTQNIDGLERLAGIEPELLMEAHGSNRTGHCLDCSATYTATWIKDCLMRDEIPKCTAKDCKGVIKPDTVFYGESLPKRFNELVDQDFHQCDLLIILGTSLKVQPFASITNKVHEETPRLYINLEKSASESKHPLCILIFGGGFKFDDDDNYRDVFLQSECDEGCYKLAELIGWKDELSNLVTTEHARLEKEFKLEQEKVKHLPVLNELFSQISLQNGAKELCNQKPDQSQQRKEQTETTHASTSGSPNQKPRPRGKQTTPAKKVQDSTNRSPSANKSQERTKSVTKPVKHKKN